MNPDSATFKCVVYNYHVNCSVKAKFYYASWFEDSSKLVADRFEAGRRPASNLSRRPASNLNFAVMA